MNASEAILQKLINDPSLIKMLEKMAKAAPAEKKAKKQKELGLACYVNKVQIHCKLCGSESIVYTRMDWDAEDKLYRTGCHHQDNIWPTLEEKTIVQRRPSCRGCTAALQNISKDVLIAKLITLAERINS